MAEFQPRWGKNFLLEHPQTVVPEVPEVPAVNTLLRLQSGSHWLTAEQKAWLLGKPDAASDERFSTGLEAWDALERMLRQVFGYSGCIFGPGSRCPEGAPVVCDFCIERGDK